MRRQTSDRKPTDKRGGTLEDRYEAYLHCADDGKGGDKTRPGEPLKTFDEWLNS